MAMHSIPPPTEPLTPDEYRWYEAIWDALEPPAKLTVRQIITATLKVLFGLWMMFNTPGFMVQMVGGSLPAVMVGALTVLGGTMALVGTIKAWAAVEEVGLRFAQIGLLLTLAIVTVVLWEGTYGRSSIAIMALLVLMAVMDADKRIALLKWRPVRTLVEE